MLGVNLIPSIISQNILLKMLALAFIFYFCWLSYLDYQYREVKRRFVLLIYPIVIYVNLVVSENILITIMSSTILFITLWVTAIRRPSSFGTIDLLVAPLVTIWFNEYAIVYSITLIIVNSLFWNLGVVKKLFSREGKDLSNPFLVTMLAIFLVFLAIVPNNFYIIFSLK